MYKAPPTKEEMEAYGMTPEDYENEEPEELLFDASMIQSWEVFSAMQTQWRTAPGGACGLDYNVLPMLFRIYKIDDEEMTLNDVRIMEGQALQELHKK